MPNRIPSLALTAVLAFSSGACVKNTDPNNPTKPTPNAGVITAIDTAAAACTISSALVSGPISTWLAGPCVTTMTGLLNIVEANGTIAEVQATIDSLKATAAALPPTTSGIQYATAAIDLAQLALNAYEQASGQTATVGTAKFAARPHKIQWTRAERVRFSAILDKLLTHNNGR